MNRSWILMLLTDLLLPAIMIGFGAYFRNHAPKEINMIFGYRTERSMKNRDTWEFAHRCCGRLWLRLGAALAVLTAGALIPAYRSSEERVSRYGTILLLAQTAVLVFSIFPVEAALKRTFDENGRRRE